MNALLKQSIAINKGLKLLLLSLFVVLVAAWQGSEWVSKANLLPIKHVRVEAEFLQLTQKKIIDALSDSVQTGYFSMHGQAIIAVTKKLPWVETAKVRRVWPDTIVLSIREQKAVAWWNDKSLLNEEGVVFTPNEVNGLDSLPRLYGADGKSKLVLNEFNKVNEKALDKGLAINVLVKAEHGSWKAEFKNGTVLLIGKLDPTVAIKRGMQVLALTDSNVIEKIDVIDLRYPNGVSVVWKKGLKPQKMMIGENSYEINQHPRKEG